MSKQLESLIKEFRENLNQHTERNTRKAKELKSLQKAIREVSKREWEQLTVDERIKVSEIIFDTTSWWYTDVV